MTSTLSNLGTRYSLRAAPALAALALLLVPTAGGAVTFSSTFGSIKVNAKPGQVITRQFELTISKGEPRTAFKAKVEDWWRSEDGRESFFAKPGTLQRSCAPWVTINPVESIVGGGETLRIRVTVAVPPELLPGGYWCVLTVDEMPDPLAAPQQGVRMRFLASVSTGIFIYIDPVTRAARIADVQVGHNDARVILENQGDTPLGVEGRLEFLRAGSEQPVAIAAISRGTILTEPISRGTLKAHLPDATILPSGRYIVRAVLDIGLDHYIGAQKELEITREPPTSVALH